MAIYRYTATDTRGHTVRGKALAADERALYAQLRRKGLYLTGQRPCKPPRRRPLGARQLADFCRGLSTLLCAGIPILQSLDILATEQGNSPTQRWIYHSLQYSLRQGASLSAAMEALGPVFPPLLLAMIRSSEGNGSTDRVCQRMTAYYEKEARARQQLLSSLLYPACLLVLVVGVIALLVGVVLPRFADLFAGLDPLPPLTALLFCLCDGLVHGWHWLVLALLALGAAVRLALQVPAVRRGWDHLRLHAPLTGRLCRRLCTARFARTLAELYACGIPILSALATAQDTVHNTWITDQFPQVLAAVRNGAALSGALAAVDGFERKLAAAMQVGEETGRLDEMMNAISDTLDHEAEQSTRRLLGLLEPLLIVVMGLVVALVVLSVMLPLYSSYGLLAG